jgi:two-component system, OmpR family, phosphate regulon response regulator PhoB
VDVFTCIREATMYTAYRILVVDDNHLIRRLLDLILEGAGYVPIEAESGEEALALAPEAAPDLCIVDEVMPGMQGSDLIRALRRSRDARLAHVPVIGISGRSGAARELLAAGATTFVAKPIDEASILAAVGRALTQSGRSSHADMPAA